MTSEADRRGVRPVHTLRFLLASEPEVIPSEEYYAKLPGWFRLLRATP
ncbi:MAG: hypothetical protein KGJ23_10515 [Euryarchaeota archaeon]|nr:hypothetical protein [Euryarchaeota archaeon]MDE1837038.1 hypothetical protein [Euryarchaeota archaeon]MDE2045696.1 hypothetical protein [Thermoplasmata archaeon]